MSQRALPAVLSACAVLGLAAPAAHAWPWPGGGGQPPATVPTTTTVPAVTVPAVTVPAVTVPAVTVPAVTTPVATTPAVTTPAVTTPAATTPAEEPLPAEQPADDGWIPPAELPAVPAPVVVAPITTPATVPPPLVQPGAPGLPDRDDDGDAPSADDPFSPTRAFPTVSAAMVPGRMARLRTNGQAAIPRGAPKRVRQLIRALNEIVGKPYKWGGGHARLLDAGYDCSGSVSYGLIRTGLLRAPLVSGSFARTFARGAGRWVTFYGNAGHVYAEVAGLRFDTSSVADTAAQGDGVHWRPAIGRRPGFVPSHPTGL